MKPLSVRLAACLLTSAPALRAATLPDLVVRHAERTTEPAGDPALTPAGEQLAQAVGLAPCVRRRASCWSWATATR